MTVKKNDKDNYRVNCNYNEITVIDYALSCVKKTILEQEAVYGIDSSVKLEATVILKIINEMLLEIRDKV